jgi:2'-5' RNA ligase
MPGVVSLLDEKHYSLIETMWLDLQKEFGKQKLYRTPFPHFSYHVAKHYDLPLLETILQELARDINQFPVKTAGLGMFSGLNPVLYIPMVRTLDLSQLQARIWNEVEKASQDSIGYYRPEMWMPHITLFDGDGLREHLPLIVTRLNEQVFSWDIEINNLALIYDNGTGQEVRLQIELQSNKL